jgi:hypothetical protein
MNYNKMVQSIININEIEDRILNIVKAQNGFKNKSEAITFILNKYAESFMEPEIRPEYLEKLKRIDEEGDFIEFSSIEELRKSIED